VAVRVVEYAAFCVPFGRDVVVIVGASTVPVPLRITGDPLTPALDALMVNKPAEAPTAVGVYTMLIVQVLPAARLARLVPQVPPAAPAGCEKGEEGGVTIIPVTAVLPVLCKVSCSDALGVPVWTFPKASGPPVMLATGPADAAVFTSIAPASIIVVLAGSGLGLPKKSMAGYATEVGMKPTAGFDPGPEYAGA